MAEDRTGMIALLGLAVVAGGALLASRSPAPSRQLSGLEGSGDASARKLLETLLTDIRKGYGKPKVKVTALAVPEVIVVRDEDVSVEG
jgi:hypothetical protein